MKTVVDRFLRYVQVDTESVPGADCFPSSEKQKNLAAILVEELKEMGVEDARMDSYGYVYATIPPTTDKDLPVIGLIAHMDTSSAVSGKDVKPRIVENYDGGDILLNEAQNIVLKTEDYPEILDYKGQDIIVTDGTTLLGADDKAGVSEIMTLCDFLMNNPVTHGTIKIAFTPDEEVGRGVNYFDVEGFGAEFAYTVDGGELGELEYENFNAASLKLTVNGVSTHPGTAKNKMKNALLMGMEFQNMLPACETPEHTEGYEGFYHLDQFEGTVEKAEMTYIIRDHDWVKFEKRKERAVKICDYLNELYGVGSFEYLLSDSYYNMKEKIEPHIHLVRNVEKAMKDVGIEPKVTAIRGGTDGARLSYMGLPCPNICTGGHNFHGRFEYIPVQSMEKVVALLKRLVEIYS
ncbi:Peptidase T [Eubacterium callanderi]|uniref:peptidase T n=1 Tax=Eubacterium callanderi TaxID=53442 RepID=UPI0029FF1DEF|nr:peptidase T [Eubacterium callanderi]WPK67339.1 Peptidase T [Eubacterium callanderi]WPK71637.1 Peptidase T [Eubacterium callanderi]